MSDVVHAARTSFADWRREVRAAPFDRESHLIELARAAGHESALEPLRAFAHEATHELDRLATETNRLEHLPRLRRYDGQGNRTEEVVFHPDYHEMGRRIYRTGIMSRYAEPGQEWVTLALTYLVAQNGEAGHTCPIACTAGLIKILQAAEDPPERWLERLLDPNYDTHFHGSQFLTEVQGGSDVGANAVVARPTQDEGWWTLHGEKWFCSVADAQLFLVTARPEGEREGTRGVQAFVVPRHLEDGSVNHFALRRLKDKLGTRSMASAEIDFHGVRAYRVGDFRDVVQIVLNTSRLYNAVACCGLIQRAFVEARSYAKNRMAFGQPILRFPSVARIVARLNAEAHGARAVTFRLAQLADRAALGRADALDQAAWRALVNLNKYWTATQATLSARDAIEIFGGNGAIEEFSVLPRLLRDGIVVEAWEGGHNVLCAQVLRDAQRFSLHEALFEWLERHGPLSDGLKRSRERFGALLSRPDADAHIRDVVDELRPQVQDHLLRATTPDHALAQVAAAHLSAIHARGWDPLADAGMAERVATLSERVS
ncbi:MAG: acyl-CoA dehydrogenase [Deltaproteobacteria bacterium]|nr:MAG: acyl-CoA dehydrogenase [Deltaproteobacteria bacterium]